MKDYVSDRCDQEVFAAWSLDENNRYNSTSGGLYSKVEKYISKNQGCYYVMCMDEVGNKVRYLEAFDISKKGMLKNVYYGQETPIIKEK